MQPLSRRTAVLGAAAAVVAIGIAVLVPSRARADVIELKDGRRLEGRVLSQSEAALVIEVPYGSITVPADEVLRIHRRPSPADELALRRAALAPLDADGRLELARFVADRLFSAPVARELALEAWRIRPSLAAARLLDELGSVYDAGDWHLEVEWSARRRLVRDGRRWITVEERARRDAAEALAAAERALAAAERALAAAEGAVPRAIAAQARALADADAARARAAGLAARRGAAESALAARQSDVASASDAVVRARGQLAWWRAEQLAQPGADLGRLQRCEVELDFALRRLADAERRRDAALREVDALARAEESAHAEVASALRRLAEADGAERAALAALPAAEASLAAARAEEPRARAALEVATRAAGARAADEAAAAARRAAALEAEIRAAAGG